MAITKHKQSTPRRRKPKVGSFDNLQMADRESLWQIFEDYVMGEGMKKFLQSVSKMPPKQFAQKYMEMLEYVKPKLARVEGKRDFEVPITITLTPMQYQVIEDTTKSKELTEHKDDPLLELPQVSQDFDTPPEVGFREE